MIARVTKRFFTCFYPQVSQQVGVGLNRVPLIIVVGCIDKFKPQIIPNGLYNDFANFESEETSF